MKRHKPKRRAPELGMCLNCASRGAMYSAGVFIDYCKADGTVITQPPIVCHLRREDQEDGEGG